MQPVKVVVVYEGLAPVKRYGAFYVLADGQRKMITTGERASGIAKEKAEKAVIECEWESLAEHKDGVLDIGHAWLNEPDVD